MTTQAWGGLSSETITITLARPIDLALAAAPDVAAAVIALRRQVGVHIPFEGGPHQENKDIGSR